MNNNYPISTADRLLMRLAHAVTSGQRVTFLAGSGLTCPSDDGQERGIPGAAKMVERARSLFPSSEEVKAFDEAVAPASEGRKYQAAMQFVIECRGQTALNDLIKNAVLESRTAQCDTKCLETLERDTGGWFLRPGVEALGTLVHEYESVFRRPILTSNFDPLLEIAVRRAGRQALTINLPNDGNFSDIVVNDQSVPVVHFHGFWRQGDTLHTPDRLTRERPLLAGNLRRLLQETVLVVIGYGGWRDVFTDSLLKAISEQGEGLDVLWGFFSKDAGAIIQRNADLLASFQSLTGQRVVVYSGVDCNDLLPKLLSRLRVVKPPNNKKPQLLTSQRPCIPIEGTSNPPATDVWVGREVELSQLLNSTSSIVSVFGLGGFGKSSLVAKYVKACAEENRVEAWYWADCKEQGNTVQTHLVKILEHLSRGQITAASLQKASDQDVLALFVEQTRDKKILIVFDNIDHYVDLETQQAIGLMDSLITTMLRTVDKTQLILTSRPQVSYGAKQFCSLQVSGLNEKDVDRLFKLRNAQWDPEQKEQQIALVLRVTHGSALHLNLIATQVAKQKVTLQELIKRIESGTAPEAEDRILSEIWNTLKQDHQIVLRMLAELPHPEPEERIASCLSDSMHFDRLHKAVRALLSLNLLVAKPGDNGPDVLELHPLVRTFIRRRFPMDERVPMVNRVVGFFNMMMGRARARSGMENINGLSNWIAKTEICVENGRNKEALETLHEVTGSLTAQGFVEEFLRLATMVINQCGVSDNPVGTVK